MTASSSVRVTSQFLISQSLRAEQLKRLSFLCGLPVSGRKEELVTRLNAATAAIGNTPPPSASRPAPVVLSIDLGIRNLAFSLFTPVSSSAAVSRKAKTKPKKDNSAKPPPSFLSTRPPAIQLHAWQRLSLLEDPTGSLAQNGDGDDALHVDATTETFAPAALAKVANTFLQETVLQLKPLPTHVLIERQRWRSGGAAEILEWTVRVNTLEAMLHASLRTLRDVGIWKGEVMSIRPERVGPLFLDGEGPSTTSADPDSSATKSKPKRKTSREAKKLKIEFMNRWLSQGDLIVRPGTVEAGHMLDAYRVASDGSRSKRVAEKDAADENPVTLDKKLDDLTDSLMQGMAWLRWQENIATLRSDNRVEKLLRHEVPNIPSF